MPFDQILEVQAIDDSPFVVQAVVLLQSMGSVDEREGKRRAKMVRRDLVLAEVVDHLLGDVVGVEIEVRLDARKLVEVDEMFDERHRRTQAPARPSEIRR